MTSLGCSLTSGSVPAAGPDGCSWPGAVTLRQPPRGGKVALTRGLREVFLAGPDEDRLLAPEVADGDDPALDLRERAVTAVRDRPLRAADRGGAVAAAGAEAALGARAQAAQGAPGERGLRPLPALA